MSIDKRGENSYRFRVSHKGIRYEATFYGTEKQAQQAHEDFKMTVKSGRIQEVQEQERQSMTLREVWELYLESKDLSYNTVRNHKNHMESFKPFLDLPIKGISRMQMQQYYNKNKRYKADGDYRNLKAVFNFAAEMELVEKNPISFKLKTFKKKKFEALLAENELKQLIDYLVEENSKISIFCLTQILIGTRYGETAGILKEAIDINKHMVKISKQYKMTGSKEKGLGGLKTSTSVRELPIPQILRVALYPLLLKVSADGFVFSFYDELPPTNVTINAHLKQYCEKLGIKKLTSHDLRKLNATIAIYSGMDMFSVAKMLGHSTTAMTEGYIKELKGKKEREANKIDNYLKDLS